MSKISDIIATVKLNELMEKKDNLISRKNELFEKADELVSLSRLNDFLDKRDEEKQKKNILWIFAIIGGVALIAAAAYVIYRFFTPDEDEWEEYPDDDFGFHTCEDEDELDFFDEDGEEDGEE